MSRVLIIGGASLVAAAGLVLLIKKHQEGSALGVLNGGPSMQQRWAGGGGGGLFGDGGWLSPEGLGGVAGFLAEAVGLPPELAKGGALVVTTTAELGQLITGKDEGSLAGITNPDIGLGAAIGYRVGEEVADAVGLEGQSADVAKGGGAITGFIGGALGGVAAVGAGISTGIVIGVMELGKVLGKGLDAVFGEGGYGEVGPGHQVVSYETVHRGGGQRQK